MARSQERSSQLLTYIHEPRNNEQSRMAACEALAWVAEKEDFLEIAKKIQQYSGQREVGSVPSRLFPRGADPAPGAGHRAGVDVVDDAGQSALETRHQVARAIAKGGFDESDRGAARSRR